MSEPLGICFLTYRIHYGTYEVLSTVSPMKAVALSSGHPLESPGRLGNVPMPGLLQIVTWEPLGGAQASVAIKAHPGDSKALPKAEACWANMRRRHGDVSELPQIDLTARQGCETGYKVRVPVSCCF